MVSTEPKDAIPAVLFSLMVATIVFIGEPPYALAKESGPGNTVKAVVDCTDDRQCEIIKNRS